ncbi:hypothetical protein B0A48_02956 [Cryoendolithus antarcticus]|uniref:Uncharacterized protein n=1 Tax=Cryoendolithus antarcticus TaxID=1507870 RepID=A0A1V8TLY2_9PEZI|nr:hypothetical protein B0A48_02956 [Cryoendolithus antarcticus]
MKLKRQSSARKPWTMAVAYFATSGGLTANELLVPGVVSVDLLERLCRVAPDSIPDLDHANIVGQSKANGLAKFLTCVQALWFCVQCLTRVTEGLAVSLLEINTFAHCLSALVIYAYWWEKPYDVGSYVDIGRLTYVDEIVADLQRACKTWAVDTTLSYIPGGKFVLTSNKSFQTGGHTYTLYEAPSAPEREVGSFTQQSPGTDSYTAPSSGNMYIYTDLSMIAAPPFRTPGLPFRVPAETVTEDLRTCVSKVTAITGNVVDKIPNLVINMEMLEWGHLDYLSLLILTLALALYGTVHLLAWHYNFTTKAEAVLWKSAGGCTAAFGLVFGLTSVFFKILGHLIHSHDTAPSSYGPDPWNLGIYRIQDSLKAGLIVLLIVDIIARAFLVVESFVALSNSPPSVYEVPAFAAYFPHFG